MEWIKVIINTTTDGTEPVTGVLISCGITGMQIIDPHEMRNFLTIEKPTWDYVDESLLADSTDDAYVVFYVPKGIPGQDIVQQVRDKLDALLQMDGEFGSLDLRCEGVNDENWLHEWKKHFKPFTIGRIAIVPEWEDYLPTNEEIVFKIDPGLAFGTGQHQTTQLCIEALQTYLKPGDKLLDVGCGSGILSIIGLLLGAEFVLACDIDPAAAVTATHENAQKNTVDLSKLVIQAGDILSDRTLREQINRYLFNIVVANIVADVVIPIASIVKEFLNDGGIFIASGIISERLDEVRAAFLSSGLTIKNAYERDSWWCVVGHV